MFNSAGENPFSCIIEGANRDLLVVTCHLHGRVDIFRIIFVLFQDTLLIPLRRINPIKRHIVKDIDETEPFVINGYRGSGIQNH